MTVPPESPPERDPDQARVESRAESLAAEEAVAETDDVDAQAEAILADSDGRQADPDTLEHTSGLNERRTSNDTVEP